MDRYHVGPPIKLAYKVITELKIEDNKLKMFLLSKPVISIDRRAILIRMGDVDFLWPFVPDEK